MRTFKDCMMSTEEIIDKNENEESQPETAKEFTEEVNKAEDSLKNFEKQIADLNDKYLRLYAEYDNFRKRSARERIEYLSSAGEDVIKAFLPINDDFERGIKANENTTDVKAVNEGVQLIFNKLQNVLKAKGIEAMQSVGVAFDPETMEAITNIPAPSPDLVGKVVDVIEKGYTMNGKVIRYAKVIVGS